jgi:hypothetical protein
VAILECDLVDSAPTSERGSRFLRGHEMRRPWVAIAGLVAVLLVLALGHRWSVTASWLTSEKTCRAAPWLVHRLDIDCGRLLRERFWKLYDEGRFGRSRSGQGAVDYMKRLEHPDE